MWFKNISIYQLTREIEFNSEVMEKQLPECAFTPCGSNDVSKFGWIPVIAGTDAMLHKAGGYIMLRAQREIKIIPNAVFKKETRDKIAQIETTQQRELSKEEYFAVKEHVLNDLIQRAFSKHMQIQLLIDTKQGFIFIDTASAKCAEDALALLRRTIGSLPVGHLERRALRPIENTMTRWVRSGDMPTGFSMLYSAELKSELKDGGVIRCTQQDLEVSEITSLINDGMLVTKLAIEWQDRIAFTLCNNGNITRLKFSDSLRQQKNDSEDPVALFDANFALMTGELNTLITQLIAELGGTHAKCNVE